MRTKNQEVMYEIISIINDTFLKTSKTPSLQEISDRIGLSKGTISKYVTEMIQKCMLERTGDHHGLMTKDMKADKGFNRLPIVGNIACGTPILAEQNIESYLTISGSFLGAGEFFVLIAKGDSMINVGIDDGDYVVIRKQSTANEGQIVVALIEDEATLKRFYIDKRKKKIRLHPENDDLEDMYYDSIDIQGIAVKVIKNINY